jgi:hypothetical protein
VSEGYCLSIQALLTCVLPLASMVTVLHVNWPAAVQAALLSSTLPPRLVHSDVVSGTAVVGWMTPVTGAFGPGFVVCICPAAFGAAVPVVLSAANPG